MVTLLLLKPIFPYEMSLYQNTVTYCNIVIHYVAETAIQYNIDSCNFTFTVVVTKSVISSVTDPISYLISYMLWYTVIIKDLAIYS